MWKEKKPDAIVIMLYIRDEIVCKTIQTLRFFVNCQKFDSKSCDLWKQRGASKCGLWVCWSHE